MSETQNLTAPALCQSTRRFALWARSIHLNQTVCHDLPDELQQLLAASRRLPKWSTDEKADIYKPYRNLFGLAVVKLCLDLARRNNETHLPTATTSNLDGQNAATSNIENMAVQDDDAAELTQSLMPILTIVTHTAIMNDPSGVSEDPNEATWRTPLDNLANFVWFYQQVPGFSHSLESRLQLPKSELAYVPDMQVNSAALFKAPPLITAAASVNEGIRRAFVSAVRAGPGFLLHWATEYKKADIRQKQDVERQTMMAMSSGLYQRRALGFPHHYVFGTSHFGGSLRVFAGTWTLVPTQVDNDEEISKKGEENQYAGPGSSAEGNGPPKKRRMVSKAKSVYADHPQPTKNKDKYEITIYELGTYELLEPLQVMDYYLLMRASRALAITYIAEMGSDEQKRRISLANYNPPLDWPAPPRFNTPTGTTASRSTRESELGDLVGSQDGLATGSDDLDMESAMKTSSSIVGDSVQEAKWEGEWRASYEQAIEAAGHGLPVHLNFVKQTRSPRSEDKVLDYFRRLRSNYGSE